MALPKLNRKLDSNGESINVLPLKVPVTIDGTAGHAETGALEGEMVRIYALTVGADNTLRFLVGSAPEALVTSHPLSEGESIWYPIKNGDKVSVVNGKGIIAVAGE